MSKYKIDNRDEIVRLYKDANMIIYGSENPFTLEHVNDLRNEGTIFFEKEDPDTGLAAEKYLKASELLLGSLEKEGITRETDLRDKKITDCIENLVLETSERLEEAEKYDESIAISQRCLEIDWIIGDERKGLRQYKNLLIKDHQHLSAQKIEELLDAYEAESVVSTSLKKTIANCYGKKGDVEKACALYEGYIQEDPIDGDYYLKYLLMLDDISSPLLAEKITLICQFLKTNPALLEMDAVKVILDLARNCGKKEEAVYLEGELDKMMKSAQQQFQSFQVKEDDKADPEVPVEKFGKYLPKKKLKELKKKGIIK